MKALESTSKDPMAPEYDSIRELLDVVDNYIPQPERAMDKPFMMPVEDVFSIKGRGTVVTGRVDRGMIKVGDPVEIVGLREKSMDLVCTGVEMFHKLLDQGMAGDNLGLLLRGITEDVERGMVVAKPKSITPHTKFMAEVYVLRRDEGGTTQTIFPWLSTAILHPHDGCNRLDHPARGCRDGNARRQCQHDEVELIVPVALEQGSKFAIREGGLTVGAGVITKY